MDCSKAVTKDGAIKLLIGGSPCTKWSIARTKDRETTASGIGWELFENYRIAKEKFQPDFFLYENNKSAAQPIKDAIYSALGGGKDSSVRLTHINSALVSAQNRQRFYVTNFGDIEQPKDRGILLKDVLESGRDLTSNDKSFVLTATYDGAIAQNTLERHQRSMVAEPVAVNLQVLGRKRNSNGEFERCYEARTDSKTSTITSVQGRRTVAEPVCVGYRGRTKNGEGQGAKTKLYAILAEFDGDAPTKAVSCADGKVYTVYEIRDGQITIKDKQYPIKLQDGYYIIRKLTPTECERLQTMPDGYTAAVSNSQRYKALGNGWTAEVIIHILNHALKDVPRDKELVVLSMYDGIATGRYCLDKMGFTNVKYYAYEIDPYAIKIAMSNYPDIVQCGDAFRVREDQWKIPI